MNLEVGDHVRVTSHIRHHDRDLHDYIGVVTAVAADGVHVRFYVDPDVPFEPVELEVTPA